MIRLAIGLAFFATAAPAQGKIFLDAKFHQTDSIAASWYRTVTIDSTGHTTSAIFNMSGKIKELTVYADSGMKIRDGLHESYAIDGRPQFSAHYKNNLREGEFRWFYPDGKLKRLETYKEDNFVSGHCYNLTGKEVVFFDYEKRPEFPGGPDKLYGYIRENFRNPERKKGIMLVDFTVDRDGTIIEPTVVKGLSPELDAEAIRVVSSMGKWIPGQQEGRPIPMNVSLPMTIFPPEIKAKKAKKPTRKRGKHRKLK